MIIKNSFLIFFLFCFQINAQEKNSEFTIKGYIKYLPSYLDYDNNSNSEINHLIHNRINLKGYFKEHFSIGFELRSRMVYGDNINISNDTGIIDLSNFFVDKPKFKLHSMIDRMWFKYQKNKIEISIGRQRVNWGINTIWNSNDLFNAYNFIDFDYIERPGSDVIRFIYNGDNLSSLEFVYKPNLNNVGVIAALYKINKIGYDFQFFGANYYDQDFALGGGWAGNIRNAGFKGEVSYFVTKNPIPDDNSFSLSTSFDYSFKNGIYILGSYLFNSKGVSNSNIFNLGAINENVLSPKNLMPSKNSYMIQTSKPISPAINSSLTFLYGQGINFLYISPNISYDINSDFDLNFIGQLFYADVNGNFKSIMNGIYLQLRYSF
tara:strand:+ start:52 stop:1185 length:1134 start_codon:yes stop_codon:yes gene_type:complete